MRTEVRSAIIVFAAIGVVIARTGGMGYFLRRAGANEIIYYLKSNPKTEDLMKKTFKGQWYRRDSN